MTHSLITVELVGCGFQAAPKLTKARHRFNLHGDFLRRIDNVRVMHGAAVGKLNTPENTPFIRSLHPENVHNRSVGGLLLF